MCRNFAVFSLLCSSWKRIKCRPAEKPGKISYRRIDIGNVNFQKMKRELIHDKSVNSFWKQYVRQQIQLDILLRRTQTRLRVCYFVESHKSRDTELLICKHMAVSYLYSFVICILLSKYLQTRICCLPASKSELTIYNVHK